MKTSILLGLAGLALYSLPCTAQISVSVDAATVWNDISDKPFGLNTNTYTDGDGNRPSQAQRLQEGLSATPFSNYLRFPGGEKSDVYKWAAAPYDDPTTSGIARTDPRNDWPAGDPSIWDTLTGTWANDDYNFAEFMVDCQVLGSEPVIAVAMDGIYKPATNGYESLTKQEAIDMAVGWVRYANVTNNYGIKYWLIGNETWQLAYNGGTLDAAAYGRDVRDFAQAMKAVDPNILIGINGNSRAYFEAALDSCVADVDFLDVHSYSCFGFDEYSDYLNTAINPRGVIGQARQAINSQAAAADRSRLFITMTETSGFGYAGGEWGQGNNIGQALANVDIFGQLARDNRLRFAQFWNTRWVIEDTGDSNGEDFFYKDNTLNASARLLTRFAQELRDEMVATSSSGVIRVFASRTAAADELTVFVINKATSGRSVELTLNNFTPGSSVTRSEFAGNGPTDSAPTYTDLATLSPSGNVVTFTASPYSLTILRFTGQGFAPDCTSNLVQNPGFETGDFDGWQTSANNVDAYVGFNDATNSGFTRSGTYAFAGGSSEAEISQLITGLQPNTAYTYTAFANYYTEEATPTPAVFGVRNHGAATETSTYARRDYVWREVVVPFTTGPSATQAEIFLNVNGTQQTYAWIDDVTLRCDAAAAETLPVSLLDFSGKRIAGSNHLSWKVTDERDLGHYHLTGRATAAAPWQSVATVAATNTGGYQHYVYTDPLGTHQYYRLSSVELDGRQTFSPIIYLARSGGAMDRPRSVHPNPTTGRLHLSGAIADTPFSLTDSRGQRVLSGQLYQSTLSLEGLPAGVYHLRLAGSPELIKVVKY